VPLPLDGATQTWRPLLSGPDIDRAQSAVAEIADAVRDPAVPELDADFANPGVAGGTSGAAVFFAQIGEEKVALDFLDRAIERASEDMPSLPLYVGTPGVGWAMAYLERSVLDGEEGDNDVDELVATGLRSERWLARQEFDLIRGVTGLGVYLVERRRPIDGVVDALLSMATETPDGHTWWVDPRSVPPERAEMFPKGYYDVGIAHGQAGVIAVLAHGLAQGGESARPLLESTLRWLRAQRLPADRGPGRYPLLFGPDEPATGGRMAWCYGDLGVSVALLAAGQALRDEETLSEAYDLALSCADRTVENTGAIDASLCHGSGGIALLFARLAHAFDDDRLADAATRWAKVVLAMRVPGEPVAGFRYSVPVGDERGWEPRAGLLEGAIGPGLALHALSSDVAPDWDLLFLTRPVR
jgi:lantibiotic modifying enzyme